MTIARIGMRVEVTLGDGITPIGRGEIVDEVTVYFARMPDGGLKSMADAESKPPQEWIDHMAKIGVEVIEMPLNPKILMDDGTIRYGCQVWWRPVQEGGQDE